MNLIDKQILLPGQGQDWKKTVSCIAFIGKKTPRL